MLGEIFRKNVRNNVRTKNLFAQKFSRVFVLSKQLRKSKYVCNQVAKFSLTSELSDICIKVFVVRVGKEVFKINLILMDFFYKLVQQI